MAKTMASESKRKNLEKPEQNIGMPSRSNKGGALRGQARAAQVKAMNKGKRKLRHPLLNVGNQEPHMPGKDFLPSKAASKRGRKGAKGR